MKTHKDSSKIIGMITGIAAGAAVGTAVGCTVKAMNTGRKPCLKRGAKKALRNVEHYIDSIM